jgi:VWA domain containing CoxE-like protein
VTDERMRRWRLVLGPEAEAVGLEGTGGEGTGGEGVGGEGVGGEGVGGEGEGGAVLTPQDLARDAALGMLYGDGGRPGRSGRRSAGLGGSAPAVARWLGDIRRYFPTSVVRVMQKDAMDRLGLRQLLLEKEMLEAVEPDVSLVSTLIALQGVIPPSSRETARAVVRQVTDELERRLAQKTRSAITGALNRASRTRRPRPPDIDWNRTIRANLRHYQPDLKTVIPERLIGYGRRLQAVQRDVVLAIDQSGSMASSVVYASVLGAVLAGIRTLSTHLVVFDTNVVDLTAEMHDPVDVLFATQLGGGTDINHAVAYCQGLITRPAETIFILVSDLMEGGPEGELVTRMDAIVRSGAVAVTVLALSDDGAPAYDHSVAARLASVGVTAFACTPDMFPDLMAAAIERRDLNQWAADRDIVTAAPGG